MATTGTPPRKRWPRILIGVLALWALFAYVAMPDFWSRFVRKHPSVDDVPHLTHGGDGLPGDPVNLALFADETRLREAMQRAGWVVADPLDLKDDTRIVVDTLAHRAYVNAPVSNLYLFGRVEDVAFEMPIGNDPSRRHHVRFWRVPPRSKHPQTPRWAGAATLDRSVGLAATTGQVTHHIAADVDAEREHVLQTLHAAGRIDRRWYVDGFHDPRSGRNAGGDPWQSDGRLGVAELRH